MACPACGCSLVSADAPTAAVGGGTTAPCDPAAAESPPAPVDVPPRVGGYRILRRLGSGGMGEVFEAEEIASGRRVALKLLKQRVESGSGSLERFRREGRLASMVSHPRCVFVLGADESDGHAYIVMELMPGRTLQDLVAEEGPLDPGDAVARILDCMDGLEEAHRLDVVHRDVKPSNCFLDADGRVKVGDFGLSRSLFQEGDLTRTGSFLGTPLYASPEQIRGDPVDARTDVYSVAATLYFLLAGQAPHEARDAAATLARIVADPPRPLAELRRDLPPALERAIARGLEKSPERRWQTVGEFRQALLPLVPGGLEAASLAQRVGAFLVDMAVFLPVSLLLDIELGMVNFFLHEPRTDFSVLERLATFVARNLLWLLYFAVLEGFAGASVGKRWLGLRVFHTATGEPPGFLRAFLRALVFAVLVTLPVEFALAFADVLSGEMDPGGGHALVVGGALLALAAGLGIVGATARARGGYRGVHDLAGGTRVVRLSRDAATASDAGGLDSLVATAAGPPEPITLGGFRVRATLRRDDEETVHIAEDRVLGRRVVLREFTDPSRALGATRREIARPGRLRWIAGSAGDPTHWEALSSPVGRTLSDVVAREGPLGWARVRPILADLTEELEAAGADGTRPRVLTVDQVWIGPGGRVQLVDFPLSDTPSPAAIETLEPEHRALVLLYEVALLALTGERARPDDPRLLRFARRMRGEPPRIVEDAEETRKRRRKKRPPPAPEDVLCPHCLEEFRARPWPGAICDFFRHFTCPRCERKFSDGFGNPRVETPILVGFTLLLAGIDIGLIIGLGRPRAIVNALLFVAILACFKNAHVTHRAARARRRPLLAVLPLHAQRLLELLPGGLRAGDTLRDVAAELGRTRGRSTEVTSGLRAARMAAAGLLLAPVICTVIGASLFPGAFVLQDLVQGVRVGEAVERLAAEGTLRGHLEALGGTSGGASSGVAGGGETTTGDSEFRPLTAGEVAGLFEEPGFRRRFRGFVERQREELLRRIPASGALLRVVDGEAFAGARRIRRGETVEDDLDDLEEIGDVVQTAVASGFDDPIEAEWIARFAVQVVAALVGLLAIWAFAWRGGVGDRIVGVAPVRASGLPAARLQCAWRSILAWAPAAAILSVGLWLELTRPELALAIAGLRLAAVAVVVVAIVTALRWPARSPLDLLAGCRLVPR